MIRRCSVQLAALLLLGSIAAPSLAKDQPKFELSDVFQLEYASDPQISPDGAWIAYVRNSMDIMKDRRRSQIWLIRSDGTENSPLTNGVGASSPRWSPDGKRLVYVSSRSGGAQIFAHWLESGRTATLTQLTSSPGDLTWSPDGKQLAFTMLTLTRKKPFISLPDKPEGAEWAEPPRMIDAVKYRADGQGFLKPGRRHLFVAPADGGSARQLTNGDFNHGAPVWAPDSKALLFAANRLPDAALNPVRSDIFEVHLADDGIKRLTDGKLSASSPVVSPDGKHVAYLGFDDRKLSVHQARVQLAGRDGKNPRELTAALDRSARALTWSSAENGLLFLYDDQGDSKIGFVSLDGVVRKVADRVGGVTIGRPYASGSYSVANDGTIAFTHVTSYRPADVAVRRHPSGDIQTLTALNDDLLSHRLLGQQEEFRYKSSHDNREIQGWIIKPPGFKPNRKYPLLLEIHGGPHANYGDRFAAELQLYAAAGYVVVFINPRGSTGYGAEFALEIHHKYPGHDYDDLMSGVDAVIKRGFVDTKNLFVTGGSGGGVLTSWIVGKTDRFRAAVAAKPVINWYSFALTSDAYPYFSQYWFSELPWENPQEYLRRSPLSLVGNVKTPTMLITGEVDYRTPMSESEQFYQALKLRKIDTALVRVPGASHSIASRPTLLMSKVAYILKWFEKYRQ